jgi:hypothetical protein
VRDDGPLRSVARSHPRMHGIVDGVWRRPASCSSLKLCALEATASLLHRDARGHDLFDGSLTLATRKRSVWGSHLDSTM